MNVSGERLLQFINSDRDWTFKNFVSTIVYTETPSEDPLRLAVERFESIDFKKLRPVEWICDSCDAVFLPHVDGKGGETVYRLTPGIIDGNRWVENGDTTHHHEECL